MLQTKQNLLDGTIPFEPLKYTEEDIGKTYTYTITEVAGSETGMEYDLMKLNFGVVVRDEGNGQLKTTVTKPDDVTFNNTYKAQGAYDIDLELNPEKEMSGRELQDQEFEFKLYKGEELIETVRNTADGNIPFKALDYTQDDIGQTYSYTIVETNEGMTAVTYDPMVIHFTVAITDAGHGKLNLNVEKSEDVVFNNSYTASGSLNVDTIINPRKSLTGRALKANEFVFSLRYGTYQVQSVRNTADGNIPFRPLNYTQDNIGQSYTYTIVEVAGRETGMKYDPMVITFTVSVEDAGEGKLNLSVTKPVDVTFNNTYTASGVFNVDTQLNPTKLLSGRTLRDNEFIFSLYYGTYKVQSVRNTANGNIPFSALRYTQADIGKTFTYQIRETTGTAAGMTYDRMVLTFRITVTDAGNGRLNLALTKPLDLVFNNTYRYTTGTTTPPPTAPGAGVGGNIGVTFE